jgi:malate dehydrogenase (oxaloacetate-decarboxylating)(NADP+)
MATGRSDFPNQVNNVLGFPFIFRGALDVQAKAISTEMKLAAVHALADLAKQSVPESVARAYGNEHFHFGPEYIIPKPFDPRVLLWEATAVARAAMDAGLARRRIDLAEYREALEARIGLTREAMRGIVHRARKSPKSIVFPEASHPRILRACAEVVDDRIASPVLLGNADAVRAVAGEHEIPLDGMTIVDPARSEWRVPYAEELFSLRKRKGVTRDYARRLVLQPNVFGALMVRLGHADGLISGVTQHYPGTVKPLLQIVGTREDIRRAVGVFVLTFRNRTFFLADATMNVEPDAECLADVALHASEVCRRFRLEPRVAMLSFSNFGSVEHRLTRLVRDATEILRRRSPGLVVDGEMQADTAVTPDLARAHFPFSAIQGDANVLVFPDLTSSNIAYKLLHRLGGAEVVGPILVWMRKPVHALHQSSEVADIVNLTAIAVADAQEGEKARPDREQWIDTGAIPAQEQKVR